MGEIGFQRSEFLNELRWWEVKSIIRGYNARHHSNWEQARLIAYNARFCIGSKDPVPTVGEWLKFPWEIKQSNESGGDIPTMSEVEAMRRQMAEMNAEFERKKKESGGQQ